MILCFINNKFNKKIFNDINKKKHQNSWVPCSLSLSLSLTLSPIPPRWPSRFILEIFVVDQKRQLNYWKLIYSKRDDTQSHMKGRPLFAYLWTRAWIHPDPYVERHRSQSQNEIRVTPKKNECKEWMSRPINIIYNEQKRTDLTFDSIHTKIADNFLIEFEFIAPETEHSLRLILVINSLLNYYQIVWRLTYLAIKCFNSFDLKISFEITFIFHSKR